MLLKGLRLGPKHLCNRCDANAFRERPQVGETRRIPAVHEDELTRLQDPELERLEVLGDHAVRTAENRGLEREAEQGREVRVLPMLVLLGGKAEGLEALHRLLPPPAAIWVPRAPSPRTRT